MKLSSNEKYALGGAVAGIVGLMIYKKMAGGSSEPTANLLGMRDFMNIPGNFAGVDNLVSPEPMAGMRDFMKIPGALAQHFEFPGKQGLQSHDVLGQHWSLLGE